MIVGGGSSHDINRWFNIVETRHCLVSTVLYFTNNVGKDPHRYAVQEGDARMTHIAS